MTYADLQDSADRSEGEQLVSVSEAERTRWDAFVASHSCGHLLQSFAWGELKGAFGWEPLRLALLEGGEIRAAAQVLFRRLPLASLAYVPRGPVVDWQDQAAVKALLGAIAQAGRAHRAVFVKIEPQLPDEPAWHHYLPTLGFRPASTVQPRSTLLVDLEASEEELLARMKRRTRYNIGLAQRRGVVVRSAAGPEDVTLFYGLLLETAQRQGFGVHTLAYFQRMYQLFNEAGRGALLLAEHEGQVLSALWTLAFGQEGINMHAASHSEGRQHKPAELLHWEAIRWARARGCHRYDLWGIPDVVSSEEEEEEAENSALWGVYRFKLGFGSRPARTVGAYDLPYHPWLYRVYRGLLEK